MKKMLGLSLLTLSLNAVAKNITPSEFNQLLGKYNACFILYNVSDNKLVSEYNPNNYCYQRIAPDSTFKIPLSLMAFDQGLINQKTVFKWDGILRELSDWNQDLTPQTWLKYSSVWVSQLLTPQLGYERIKHYLADFNYGNQNFSGDPGQNNGLQYAWLGSSLKISAIEQFKFLKSVLTNKLKLSKESVINTKANLYQGKLENGADYYGKTGSGRHGRNERMSNPSKLRDGWFVGFVENNHKVYIFVSNLSDKVPASADKDYGLVTLTPYGSQVLKPITLQLLNSYF